jgi:hypothetical protein
MSYKGFKTRKLAKRSNTKLSILKALITILRTNVSASFLLKSFNNNRELEYLSDVSFSVFLGFVLVQSNMKIQFHMCMVSWIGSQTAHFATSGYTWNRLLPKLISTEFLETFSWESKVVAIRQSYCCIEKTGLAVTKNLIHKTCHDL